MKRFIGILCILLLMTSCIKHVPPSPTIESTPTDPTNEYTQFYTINHQNFESVFEVVFKITLHDNLLGYDLTYEQKPLLDALYDIDYVDFMIDVMIIFEDKTFESASHSMIFYINQHANQTTFTSYTEKNVLEILPLDYYIDDVSGTISSKIEITFETFSYPIILNTFNPETHFSPIQVSDPILNQQLYDDLFDWLDFLDITIDNHLSMQVTESIRIHTLYESYLDQSTSSVQLRLDPFLIYMQENDQITSYETYSDDLILIHTFNLNNHFDEKFIVNTYVIDALESNETQDIESSFFDTFIMLSKINPLTMPIERELYGFKVTGLAKNILDEQSFLSFSYLLMAYDQDPQLAENMIITLHIEYIDDIFIFTQRINLPLDQPVAYFNLFRELKINTQPFNLMGFSSRFENLELFDDFFIFNVPNDPNFLFELKDPLSLISSPLKPDPHYYLVYLDAGTYRILDSNDIQIDIFDDDLMPLDQRFYQAHNIKNYRKTLTIIHEGIYILKVSPHMLYRQNEPYTFRFIDIDDYTNFDTPHELLTGSFDIDIPNEYAIFAYEIHITSNQLLHFESQETSIEIIRDLYTNTIEDSFYKMYTYHENGTYMYLETGKHTLYFVSPLGQSFTRYTLQLVDFEKIDHFDVITMTLITETYPENYWFIGGEIGLGYLKIEVETGNYYFDVLLTDDRQIPRLMIYDAASDQFINYIYTDTTLNVYLPSGTYYISIDAHDLLGIKIKYALVQ